MQNISLWSSGMRRKQNFEVVFTFRFLSLSLFSFFLPHFFFFSWALILVGFILVGKVFRKAFRILGLDERKGRWVVKQDFHGKFWVNVTWFLAIFAGFLDWVVLILVWFERSLHSAYVSRQSYPWLSKLMMSQNKNGTVELIPAIDDLDKYKTCFYANLADVSRNILYWSNILTHDHEFEF